jgi:hypothetical protein
MVEISNINGVVGAAPTRAVAREGASTVAPHRGEVLETPEDAVEFSDVGLRLARELPSHRAERIQQLREEIANETFETEARIEGTVDRLLEELLK